mmetsp:Transcript_14954/g.7276  ORF Transcript_14954/g.7276 Transcript_14954/m.7276 type:complete len:103 (+) Transcript_14954:402-710(+)|eukprot:CAMPEP_0201282600 /NCGR_PEP_ID=MMETSP1317-20130820/6101_1 /ASSEMBLY_ACC=CAM_ASM_000770 /TAXON_ID=187299 /ORGANISM="Undescribed Undescribed, Strain Undescribed" /LENGTH=102 /DNA_ID=CAMNT_0047595791 /DNA_START=800 /DNA_END=1108 /DNA_ORIENTATION=-
MGERDHKVLELLQTSDPITKLRTELQETEYRLAEMQMEWESYSQPIERELQENKKTFDKVKEKKQDRLEEIQLMKEEARALNNDMLYKEELTSFLKEEVASI